MAGLAGAAGVVAVSPTVAPAHVLFLGDEQQVNTLTTDAQRGSDVAVLPDGSYVVVWYGLVPSAPGAELEIRGRGFASDDTAGGDEFAVNAFTPNSDAFPSIAPVSETDFVVVRQAARPFLGGSSDSILGRFVNDTGPLGSNDFALPETAVTTADTLDRPQVASDADGNFIVVWGSTADVFASLTETTGTPTANGNVGPIDPKNIVARRFDSDGIPVGTQFVVNSYTTGLQTLPAIAMDDGGRFAVVWVSQNASPGDDTDGLSVVARSFDSAAVAQGGDVQVNVYTSSSQSTPKAAYLDNGRFVVAWTSYGSTTADYDFTVTARLFDNDGTPATGEFAVNSFTTGWQRYPDITARDGGGFVVVWDGEGPFTLSDPSQDRIGIFVRAFDASAEPEGPPLLVNTPDFTDQERPALAANSSGTFVVTWTSYTSAGGDDDSATSVQSRRFCLDTDEDEQCDPLAAPPTGECGDPSTSGLRTHAPLPAGTAQTTRAAGDVARVVTATDALFILNTAVGLASCLACVCDVDDSGTVTASDALRVLQKAVGIDVTLTCPSCP